MVTHSESVARPQNPLHTSVTRGGLVGPVPVAASLFQNIGRKELRLSLADEEWVGSCHIAGTSIPTTALCSCCFCRTSFYSSGLHRFHTIFCRLPFTHVRKQVATGASSDVWTVASGVWVHTIHITAVAWLQFANRIAAAQSPAHTVTCFPSRYTSLVPVRTV